MTTGFATAGGCGDGPSGRNLTGAAQPVQPGPELRSPVLQQATACRDHPILGADET